MTALQLQLPSVAESLAEQGHPGNRELTDAVAKRVADLKTALGIPGEVRVTTAVMAGSGATDVIRLSIDGKRVRYPDDVLLYVFSYVNQRVLDPTATREGTVTWLAAESGAATVSSVVVEFLSLSCEEIIKRQPAALFGLEEATQYLSLLQAERPDAKALAMDARWLMAVLRQVLALRISIANRRVVGDALISHLQEGGTAEAIVEALIDALRSDVVEIQAHPEYLRELTIGWEAEGPSMFPFLRDGMWVELGLTFPPLRFVPSSALKPKSFAFKVNHLLSLPLHGLSADQWLVNDSPERLLLKEIVGTATVSPATGQPNSVIHKNDEARATQDGLTTWSQIQYLVLALAEYLRRHAASFVHRSGVTRELDRLASAFPSLVQTVRSRISDDEVTRVWRGLFQEGVSVRNLRALLEHLLDYGMAATPPGAEPIDPRASRAAGSLEFMRVGLGWQITHKAARNTQVLVVYLLDQRIERMLAPDAPALSEEQGDEIVRAIRLEMSYLPQTAQAPNLLTTIESRSRLRQLVASEFPRLSVLAHEELPRGTNVMPVARINL